MPVASASRADILVIADADVWCDGVGEAVDAIEGGAGWAVPHDKLYRLTEQATAGVLAGGGWPGVRHLDERPYRGHEGGGIVVLPKPLAVDVPLDPRFRGWGHEDDSWAIALSAVAGGPWRGTEPLWHLWHPPQVRVSRRIGSDGGKALFRRYWAARNRPEQIRALLREAV